MNTADSKKPSKIWWIRFKDLKPSKDSPASNEASLNELLNKVRKAYSAINLHRSTNC